MLFRPIVHRFKALEDEDQEAFRYALIRFVRTYGFLAQIVSFSNPGPESDYQYCRALGSFIRRERGTVIDLSSEVELTYLRHEMTFERSISLPEGKGVVTAVSGGLGPTQDSLEESLAEILARINERFGADLTEEDRLVFEGAAGGLFNDIELQNQAVNKDEENFRDHVPPQNAGSLVPVLQLSQAATCERLEPTFDSGGHLPVSLESGDTFYPLVE